MARKNGVIAKKILSTRTSQLAVTLTDPEVRRAGEKLAQLEGEVAAHVLKAKDVTDQLKSTRSSLDGQIHALAAIIRQGFEYRPVPVRVEADFEAKKVFEIREDTGEVIGERDVNEQDRQASIFELTPAGEKPLAAGETTITLTQPNGKSVTATQGQMRSALDELERRKGSKKFPLGSGLAEPCTVCGEQFGVHAGQKCPPKVDDSKPVIWHDEDDGRILAESTTDHLMYTVEPDGDRWCWKQGKSRGRGFVKLSDAKADVERTELVRLADAKLKNAGHGELTGKAVTGEATAFRKGARR